MIPFNDLRPLVQRYRPTFDAALARVLDRGWFILGPEVEAFESEFAAYHGPGQQAVAVGHGTDAIELALRAAGIGPGDEVITTPLTAVPTVCAIEGAGARPVFADIDPRTCNIDAAAVRAAITPRTRAVVPVHLYGRPADMPAILEVARSASLLVIEDCAQAHGARIGGRLVGTFGDAAAFSFYPTKNLGAFGDAGAVLTADAVLAERVRRLRNYGQADRYQHVERGVNSRLDDIQAALLRVLLARLDEHNDERRRLAARYRRQLRGVGLPADEPGLHHVYHLFVVRHPDRDALQRRLRECGVGSMSHYPRPVHLQPAYADLGYPEGSLPAAERAAREVLSLPLYVGLADAQVDHVCGAVAASRQEVAA
jgi:dTDP-3-amino-3,4,6-trideoxy-alpha-D-glucose transaminase